MKHLLESALAHSYSYAEYRLMLDELMAAHKTTGENQSEQMLEYAYLNLKRMSRWEKTAVLLPEATAAMTAQTTPLIWLVITEGWCGDAAQTLPFLAKMADLAADSIQLRLVLRDEHTALMDNFLTNGGRAIPKLLVLHPETLEVLTSWGPRPAPAQQLHMANLVLPESERQPKSLISEQIHRWYAQDKGITFQHEIIALLHNAAIAHS